MLSRFASIVPSSAAYRDGVGIRTQGFVYSTWEGLDMFRERYRGPYRGKSEMVEAILRLLARRGIEAKKAWFDPLDSRHEVFPIYLALCGRRSSRRLDELLRQHAAVPTDFRFVVPHDSYSDVITVTARSLREAAFDCAARLKLSPRTPEEAIELLHDLGVQFPKSAA